MDTAKMTTDKGKRPGDARRVNPLQRAVQQRGAVGQSPQELRKGEVPRPLARTEPKVDGEPKKTPQPNEEAVNVVLKFLKTDIPDARVKAAKMVAKIGTAENAGALAISLNFPVPQNAQRQDPGHETRVELTEIFMEAISNWGDASIPHLESVMDDEIDVQDPNRPHKLSLHRKIILEAAKSMRTPEVLTLAEKGLELGILNEVLGLLDELAMPESISLVDRIMSSDPENGNTLQRSITILRKIGTPECIPVIGNVSDYDLHERFKADVHNAALDAIASILGIEDSQ